MIAEGITIECEEDGFWMVVEADQVPHGFQDSFCFRFRITDPEALYDHVKAVIGPWLRERDAAKIEYDRMKRTEDTRGLSDEDFSAYLDDAYGDDWSKREGMKQMRERGYA